MYKQKVRTICNFLIGSFGLPHPLFPIMQDSPHRSVNVPHYLRKTVFKCGRLKESLNKRYVIFWRTLAPMYVLQKTFAVAKVQKIFDICKFICKNSQKNNQK